MIRHIQNAVPHSFTSHSRERASAKASAETNPFRSVLDTAESSPRTPVSGKSTGSVEHAQIAKQDVATITGTITKAPAKPVVTLAPPVFEYGATVTNPDNSTGHLNWTQFADLSTSEGIAAKLGGTVVDSTMDGYSTTQRSVRVPGSPNLVNAGIAAQLFAQYGDKPGSAAWQIINRDLGRDPMST